MDMALTPWTWKGSKQWSSRLLYWMETTCPTWQQLGDKHRKTWQLECLIDYTDLIFQKLFAPKTEGPNAELKVNAPDLLIWWIKVQLGQVTEWCFFYLMNNLWLTITVDDACWTGIWRGTLVFFHKCFIACKDFISHKSTQIVFHTHWNFPLHMSKILALQHQIFWFDRVLCAV